MNSNEIIIAKSDKLITFQTNMLNRHGLITGTTGSGKTVTLKVLAENYLSKEGIPVFLADIKGDLSGLTKDGTPSDNITKRISEMDLENFKFESFPVRFFDIFGKRGIPVRTTISDIGPEL